MKLPLADSVLWHEVSGDGIPMVMLPGGPGFAHDYLRPYLDPLAAELTIVWVDLPGTGRSVIESGVDSISHGRWIADLEALRTHLGWDRWIVFGHSYAGFVAVDYALAHPASVTGLVLCASAPSAAHLATLFDRLPPELTSADREFLEALFGGQILDHELEAAVRTAVQFFVHSDLTQEDLNRFLLQPDTFRHVLGACLPAVAIEDRIGEVAAPTLVVAGDADWQLPEGVAKRLAAGIPGADVAIIAGAGHYPFIDDSHRFVAAVTEWLRRAVLS